MPAEVGRVKLALLSPGQLVRVEHPPFHVLVTRVGDALFALEDACPHSGVSLCRGALEGRVLTCVGHGWQIDVCSGAVVKPTGVTETNPRYDVTCEGEEAVIWSR